MRHPQLFILLPGTLKPPYRLGIATTKELKVAEARLDLGNRYVHAARARAFQSALVKFFGTLKVVQLGIRSEEHTSELQSRLHLVCRLLLEKKKNANDAP